MLCRTFCLIGTSLLLVAVTGVSAEDQQDPIRVGIIGLDTSHAIAFTKVLNDSNAPAEVAGCRIVAAYPKGSRDIESSVSRVPKYTQDVQTYGVEIVDSIDELLTRVDVVLLETNDGRPHLEQVRPVIQAGKPVFIDKPIAGSLRDAVTIFAEAKAAGVPLFSSSSLRFGKNTQEARHGSLGRIVQCETHSPASLEPHHPDLFWYGIHGVESLFAVMGTGCQSVVRTTENDKIKVVGKWSGGRTGTFRELKGYGGSAQGDTKEGPVGSYDGYAPLVVEIVKFFRTGKPPVSAEETLEIYAFMEAADESKRQGGAEVTLESVLQA
ncbi:MAG: Gfo/Idh/MocA family protein, partial [Pirellulaceae bacterium]